MPLLKAKLTTDLSQVPETDLITELYNRDISLEHIEGSYYALGEMESHHLDEVHGYSEAGLHGAASDLPKKPAWPKMNDEAVDLA